MTEPKSEKKYELPHYVRYSGPTLIDRLHEAHEIDHRQRVHKPREREDRTKVHVEHLKDLIKGIIKERAGKETYLTNELEDEAREEIAGKIVDALIRLGYSRITKKEKKGPEDITDRERDMYLQHAGVDIPYETLIKKIRELDDLSYENLERELPQLKGLIDHVANASDDEGYKIQKMFQTLATDPEKRAAAVPRANEVWGANLPEYASFEDIQKVFQAHIASQDAAYKKAHVGKKEHPDQEYKAA